MATTVLKLEKTKSTEPMQKNLPGLEEIGDIELFSFEEADREYKAARRVGLKSSFQDGKGRTWPEGTIGRVIGMRKSDNSYVLTIQMPPPINSISAQLPTSVTIRSARLYSETFEKLSPDHRPLEK